MRKSGECRCGLALVGLAFGFAATVSGGTLLEDFNSAPHLSGWRVHGNSNLFTWDGATGNLRITWDSSQPNSYYYKPLGTVLARDDDFQFEFDLRLNDITTGAKSGPFEIAIGLINLGDATGDDFWRGSGVNPLHGPRNLVEFDYFPAGYYPGWGDVDPSISPTLVSKDNQFASAFTLLQLTNDALYHVSLQFTASNHTLKTTILADSAAFGPVGDAVLGTNFTDFRVDTVAIASYSDTGNDYDSVLAHGVVDNVRVTTPPPPVAAVAGSLDNGIWRIQLLSRTNWAYTLERTEDFARWAPAAGTVAGNGEAIVLEDRTPPAKNALYRIRAERP